MQDYKAWLSRVAVREFADEIILAAVALHLRVWIVVVPFTPPTARQSWALTEYPHQNVRNQLQIDASRRIFIGSNDVHYVWLPHD